MTLTMMQGHNGLAEANIQRWIISITKQAISIKLATTEGHFLFTWQWLSQQLYGLTILGVFCHPIQSWLPAFNSAKEEAHRLNLMCMSNLNLILASKGIKSTTTKGLFRENWLQNMSVKIHMCSSKVQLSLEIDKQLPWPRLQSGVDISAAEFRPKPHSQLEI